MKHNLEEIYELVVMSNAIGLNGITSSGLTVEQETRKLIERWTQLHPMQMTSQQIDSELIQMDTREKILRAELDRRASFESGLDPDSFDGHRFIKRRKS